MKDFIPPFIKRIFLRAGRGVRLSIEICGILALCLFLAWAGLLWRLSQGPLEISFLSQRLEKEISDSIDGFTVTLGPAALAWNGGFSPIEIKVSDVDVRRNDETPVMHIANMTVGLSQKNLLMGRISLKRVNIFKPAIRVIRWEDGQVTLNSDAAPEAETLTAKTEQPELLQNLLAYLNNDRNTGASPYPILDGLREVSMSNAGVLYEDRILKATFISRNADISILRRKKGLAARLNLVLDAPAGGNQGYMRAEFSYDAGSRQSKANISFRDINPSQIVLSGDASDIVSGIDLSLKGVVDLSFNEAMGIEQMQFALGSEAGALRINDLYEDVLSVKNVFLRGMVQPLSKTGIIERAEVAFADGPSMEAVISASAAEADQRKISIKALLHEMPMDALSFYWPKKLAADPREWVTHHLSKGTAHKASLSAELLYDPAAEKKISAVNVGGDIDFTGIKVDYFPPLQVVTDVAGRAFYDMSSFNLDITGGKLDDMTVTSSKIRITGLDEQDEVTNSHIDIDVDLNGPLKTALTVLDSKPLQYPSALGLKTENIAGEAAVSVNFKFPLHKDLTTDQVKVSAKAKINNALLSSVVSGMDIAGGPMDLTVSNGALHVAGNALLGDMPVDFDWTKSFLEKTAADMDLTAKIALSPQGLKNFGLPEDIAITGKVPATVSYALKKTGDAQLKLAANIMTPEIAIPDIKAVKPAGDPGNINAILFFKNEKLTSVRDLDMTSDALTLRGNMDFDTVADETVLRKADLPVIKLGDTDIMLHAEKRGNQLDLAVSGRQLDASAFFPENQDMPNDAEAAKKVQPVNLTLKVAKMVTGENRALETITMGLERNEWNRIERLDLYALAGKQPLTVKYTPNGGGKKLFVEARNAGAALNTLGVSKSLRGGRLVINAQTAPKTGNRDLRGAVILSDFGLKDAPLVAKLLNAMSLSGLQSLLTGEGVQFKKAKVSFDWIDRGQPQQTQNVRLLKLRDGQTSGSSLGLTFEGAIDNWKSIYDLNGTIVPVSDINKMLNVIPVIGNVLTAGGEGIIAATYKIQGPMDQPSISVNPLAVLAPGILRKIFFE